jgi:hypothetical protein
LRHARIHDQLASNPQYAGGIGWCAFDYNTHANFGSGDRICYHGVTDIFREPKPAAGFYKSQCDPEESRAGAGISLGHGDESVGFPKPLSAPTATTSSSNESTENYAWPRIDTRTTPWDMVVIGGGATGVGVAIDAASRGFEVLLLEAQDFGKGTSSRSTKLIHGGVRYLEQGNISLVMEALKERGLLRQNAPHLVHDLAFIVPNYSWWEAPFYGIGMKVYDLLAGKYGFGKSRILSSQGETLEKLPNLRPKACAAASSTTTASSTTRACSSTWPCNRGRSRRHTSELRPVIRNQQR